MGGRCCSRLKHCATSWKIATSIPDVATGIFLLTWSFRPHKGPGVDSASDRHEYQKYLLTTFMCWLSRNSETLNLQQS